jgi:CRISPR/Cas system-associated endonuclease Cas1
MYYTINKALNTTLWLDYMAVQENKKPYKTRRIPLWLPYLQSANVDAKGIGHFVYNGGEEHIPLTDVSSIMIYGDTDTPLQPQVLDAICRKGIPIIIHRRNLAQSIVVCGNGRPDPDDTLTAQIMARENEHKSAHIARALLRAKFHGSSWLVTKQYELPLHTTVSELRNVEAHHAKKYWQRFYAALGKPELSRRSSNPYSQSLDAGSKFLSGIVLRWIGYHHLSPYHGYLHEPTTYPSLVYDLMEPYRPAFDADILRAWKAVGTSDPKRLLSITIATLKESLNTKVYVPLTRQIVTRQELLHGAVLSLKYYVLGRQSRMLIPMEGKPNGGRPPQVEFLLYGRHAGRTDFWKAATEAAKNTVSGS